MGSTRGRKPRELTQAVRQSLTSHQFTLKPGTTMEGATQYAHPLAVMRLAVSMSETGRLVQWQWRGVPEHLLPFFRAVVEAGDVDAFERMLAGAETTIVNQYPLGAKVADRMDNETRSDKEIP